MVNNRIRALTGLFISCFVFMAAVCGCGRSGKDDTDSCATCMEDLRGKKVCVLLGSLQDVLMPDVGADMMRLNNIPDVLLSVEKGTSDYCLQDSVLFIGADLESRGLQLMFTDNFCYGEASLAFRLDDVKSCEEFNSFLAAIKEDGTFSEMRARWIEGDPNTQDIPDDIVMPKEGKPIIVGTLIDFPFTFIKDNKWSGFETEMLYRFGAWAGRPVEMVNYEFPALAPALASGKVDLLCCFLFKTEERAKRMLFSDPYFYSETACVGRIPGRDKSSSGSFWQNIKESFHNNFIQEDRWKLIVKGLWETIIISLFALLLGTLLGAVLCFMSLRGSKFIRGIAKVYIDIMQGVPILVFLMIMFYVVFSSGAVSARWVAIIAFGMNLAAYVSEMMKSAINGIEKGQTEAGLAMGFSRVGTFVHFIMPQAVKRMLPVYRGEAISLIKSTSIVGYIAIQDLTKMSDIIRSRTFDAFFPLIMVSIIYFVIAWLLARLLDSISKKLK